MIARFRAWINRQRELERLRLALMTDEERILDQAEGCI